jgi:hypothetical protein
MRVRNKFSKYSNVLNCFFSQDTFRARVSQGKTYNEETGEVYFGADLGSINKILNKKYEEYGLSYSDDEIASMNGIANKNKIYAGKTTVFHPGMLVGKPRSAFDFMTDERYDALFSMLPPKCVDVHERKLEEAEIERVNKEMEVARVLEEQRILAKEREVLFNKKTEVWIKMPYDGWLRREFPIPNTDHGHTMINVNGDIWF